MAYVSKMDEDIKDVAKRLIQSNEKRKKRIQTHKESEFDRMAAMAIADALVSSCGNIASQTERNQMQGKIYRSIVFSIPYEYLGDVRCGRRQFYDYRNEFIMAVADKLGMLPNATETGKEHGSSRQMGHNETDGYNTLKSKGDD